MTHTIDTRQPAQVAVACRPGSGAPVRARAERMAERLGVDLLDSASDAPENLSFVIVVDVGGVELAPRPSVLTRLGLHRRTAGPRLAFGEVLGAWQRRALASGSELLARALGRPPGTEAVVVDATAGLGDDGLLMAALGWRVLWIERHPVLAAMLALALETARAEVLAPGQASILARIELMHGDGKNLLPAVPPPAAIYLDPMYPQGARRGEANKRLRLLRVLVGDDTDAETLLHVALTVGAARVVVKRPQRAGRCVGEPPVRTVAGRAVRFDVYQARRPKGLGSMESVHG